MSAFKDLAKGGWHPGGKKESTPNYNSSTSDSGWRNKYKGANTVAGWVGRPAKDNYRERYENHQSTPLGALKDPDTFGPPPKHYGGSTQADTGLATPNARRDAPATPSRPKPGSMRAQAEAEAVAEAEPPIRRGPFQSNTTGLDTSNLPVPPVRRNHVGIPTDETPASQPQAPRAPPKLPPRLPPRQVIPSQDPPSYTAATEQASSPAARTAGLLNTAAAGRLGQAGVSVPGFNIGQMRDIAAPRIPSRTGFSNASPTTETSGATQSVITNGGGTTWAQKRAALDTAQKMRQDPSSVSFSELKSSATTANNFRERHGDQVSSGLKFANKMNAQYGSGQQASPVGSGEAEVASGGERMSLPFRKPAVPPPLGAKSPPPVPHGSKPVFP